jgi:inorganic phosphate transporter, PiT family
MEMKFLEYLTIIIGFYMAWNIGANDVANAVSTSVGSKALTLKKAVILAGIFEFVGAYFLGTNVSTTIQYKIIDPSVFINDPNIFILGMIASLLATGIWLNLASFFKHPISTTHAIVGAVLGFGVIIGGVHSVNWLLVFSIILSWLITPLFSASISYFIFSLLQKRILFALSPIEATKKFIPRLIFFSFAILTLIITFAKLSYLNVKFNFLLSFICSFVIGLISFFIAYFLIRKIKVTSCPVLYHDPSQVFSLKKAKKHLLRLQDISKGYTQEKTQQILEDIDVLIDESTKKNKFHEESSDYYKVEKVFGYLQIISLCLIALAHGSNDVANAVGPVAAVIHTISLNKVLLLNTTSHWILLIGAIGIVIGLATWGFRVIDTIGHKITQLTPTRGFSAEFATAITILIASKFGLPISTTHALVGAILGVAMAKGLSALNLKTLKDVVASWAVTIPISAIFCILIFYILKLIFH